MASPSRPARPATPSSRSKATTESSSPRRPSTPPPDGWRSPTEPSSSPTPRARRSLPCEDTMTTSPVDVQVDVHLTHAAIAETLATDVRTGLTASPKELPPKWFYDERGSELFDEITRLPEYHPTPAQRSVLLLPAHP